MHDAVGGFSAGRVVAPVRLSAQKNFVVMVAAALTGDCSYHN
jgi:hypothetical protein